MSVRKMRSTDQMNNHNSIRKPARVSCSTSPCIRRPLRPGAACLTCPDIATSRYLDGGRRGVKPMPSRPTGSVDVDDDLRVPQPDHVTVGQLPLLNRRVVDGGAVGGVEVGQQCDLAVPPNLQMATRHPGVRQPELCILAAANDVRAFTQLIGAPAAVVELQRDRRARGRAPALLSVAAVAAGLRGLAVVVVTPGLGVPAAATGWSVGLAVVLSAISAAAVALVVARALVRVAAARVWCAVSALVRIAAALFGIAPALVVARGVVGVAAALLFGVAAAWVGCAVAGLFGVAAAWVGCAVPGLVGVAAALLFGVAARFRLVPRTRIGRGMRVVMRMRVRGVVVVVAGPSLPLAAAVARILTHRWYSWFCAERTI